MGLDNFYTNLDHPFRSTFKLVIVFELDGIPDYINNS